MEYAERDYRQNLLWLHTTAGDSVPMVEDNAAHEYAVTLGSQLLSFRAGKFTQRTLAAELGVGESKIKRWEDGSGVPDAWEIRRLCEILGCEPHELIYPTPMSDRERELTRRAARRGRSLPRQEPRAS